MKPIPPAFLFLGCACLLVPSASAAVLVDPFPNLENSLGLSSQRHNGTFTLAGFRTVVTQDLFLDRLQVVFGFNAIDTGSGLDVGSWGLSLEIWTNEDDVIRQRNGVRFDLPLDDLRYLDGSAAQTIRYEGRTTFATLSDHGESYGDPNFLFAAVLSGQSVAELQESLVLGGELFGAIVNTGHPGDGTYFTLTNPGISNQAFYLTNERTLTYPTGFGVALSIQGVPETSCGSLMLLSTASLLIHRRRNGTIRPEKRPPANPDQPAIKMSSSSTRPATHAIR